MGVQSLPRPRDELPRVLQRGVEIRPALAASVLGGREDPGLTTLALDHDTLETPLVDLAALNVFDFVARLARLMTFATDLLLLSPKLLVTTSTKHRQMFVIARIFGY